MNYQKLLQEYAEKKMRELGRDYLYPDEWKEVSDAAKRENVRQYLECHPL